MAKTTKQKLSAIAKNTILPSVIASKRACKARNAKANGKFNAKAASIARDGHDSVDLYQRVTNRIIEQMERAARWEKPWTFGAPEGTNFARPVNLAGKPYRGINVPLLWSAGYASPLWGTFRAWQDKGACVRKGEKATRVLFWKKYEKAVKDDAGEDTTDSFLVAREYCVFNVEQVDGYAVPVAEPVAPITPEQRNLTAERFFAATGAKVRFGGGRAFYTTGDDHIQMPPFGSFVGTTTSTAPEAFYGTLAHETIHNAVIRIMPHDLR